MVSGEDIAIQLGFGSCSDPAYLEYVHDVKHEFLRREHPELLEGPQAMARGKGSQLDWEKGLDSFYEKYSSIWLVDNFGSAGNRRLYAHAFLVAQAKKARHDISLEQKKAVKAAKRAVRPRAPPVSVQKARGRKRPRAEQPGPQSPTSHGYSSPAPTSSQPSPKRRRDIEMPNVKFKEFALILKGPRTPPASSYGATWRFEDLLEWILKKLPDLRGGRVICWTEVTIRNEEYSDMLGCALNEKCNRFISDQASWDATVITAQANRPTTDTFMGLPVFACLEADAPEHDESDIIDLQNEGGPPETADGKNAEQVMEEGLGNVGIAGGGDVLCQDVTGEENTRPVGEVDAGGEEPTPGSKSSITCM